MKFLDKVGVTYWTSKLKSYVNTKIEDLKNLLSKDIEKKQDKLTAGDNIQIDSDTISVIEDTDKRFVSDYEKSIWNGKQDKLTTGENITITNNKISATDTVYTHPDKHKPSEIETDANNRFVTDEEKNTWNEKQDSLTSGDNITITDNKISAVDTTYTAGTNVTITGTTISAKDTIYDDTALKTRIAAVENREDKDTTYTAGTNVQISAGNVISATDTKYTAGANITIDSGNKISAEVPTINYPVKSVNSKTGEVTITKSDVGLGAVNNVAITAAQVTKINQLNYTRALTQAQYDALSTAEKNRADVWYGIYK